MTKPKKWIERMTVRCTDRFHEFLMSEFGYEEYVKRGLVHMTESDLIIGSDLWYNWQVEKEVEDYITEKAKH